MFQVGDLVLYGTTGVCRVMEIAKKDLTGKGNAQLYYHLSPLYQTCMISAPVDSEKIFIRPIISRKEAEKLIDQIPALREENYETGAARELTEKYEAAINTHDCRILIQLISSINAKKLALEQQKRKFSALDERYMRRAEDLLHGELAAALGIAKNEVPSYIESRIQATHKT